MKRNATDDQAASDGQRRFHSRLHFLGQTNGKWSGTKICPHNVALRGEGSTVATCIALNGFSSGACLTRSGVDLRSPAAASAPVNEDRRWRTTNETKTIDS